MFWLSLDLFIIILCSLEKSEYQIYVEGESELKMPTKHEFYITLPSNVKTFGHLNTISNFKTRVSKRYQFPQNEDWRVGLAEIIYTKTWYNVQTETQIKFLDQRGRVLHKDVFERTEGEIESPYLIKAGYYETVEVLVDAINEKLKVCKLSKGGDHAKLVFDKIRNKVIIKCGYYMDLGWNRKKKYFIPIFDTAIEKILGLHDEDALDLFRFENAEIFKLSLSRSMLSKFDSEKFNLEIEQRRENIAKMEKDTDDKKDAINKLHLDIEYAYYQIFGTCANICSNEDEKFVLYIC